ncbi:hypothetical protein AA11825_0071 [Acetobacter pomorum DSM 11825]|uniref:hypothetical protein n=1 Tax=Acetobacter pomorum TaxID=65959 RepID=UPI0017CAA157|nr:hypothetical protein [Acetobacter pomorum]GBR45528.1 hypothetical protein AA11825_0071 [Acetobacter pomorum DSM 11825]
MIFKVNFNVSWTEKLLPDNIIPVKKPDFMTHARNGMFSHPDVLLSISTVGAKSGESSGDRRDSRRGECDTGMSPV